MPKAKATPAPAPQEEMQYSQLQYDVNIYPSRGDSAQKASATVNINDAFAIRGIKIMEGSRGLFVSMPSYRAANGEYKDICFPCTKESRRDFDKAVMTAYEQKMSESQTAQEQETAPTLQEQEQIQPVLVGM